MPAKGWKKMGKLNSTFLEENSPVSIEELLFPKSTILKIAKSAFETNDNNTVIISKDSTLALQRAATVFVNYIGEYARQVALSKDKVIVTANDVLEALSSMGFEEFVPELNNELNAFNAIKEQKKLANKQRQLERASDASKDQNSGPNVDVDEEEEEDTADKMDLDEELESSEGEGKNGNDTDKSTNQKLEAEMKELTGEVYEAEINDDEDEDEEANLEVDG